MLCAGEVRTHLCRRPDWLPGLRHAALCNTSRQPQAQDASSRPPEPSSPSLQVASSWVRHLLRACRLPAADLPSSTSTASCNAEMMVMVRGNIDSGVSGATRHRPPHAGIMTLAERKDVFPFPCIKQCHTFSWCHHHCLPGERKRGMQ